ncbi:hypothetical protein [Streptomyces sp. H27-C3]|uniref:hypothetical protein n=1 Tax=Streptomyces sp. H27-C3 TaxID=3046305 RepID=UPI0024BB83D5|nr:hypothetical protein [Streptomyces sp. H27-C3]MDJ0462084.1 hypothetical protein [Streptomyces sp. H27-C3]
MISGRPVVPDATRPAVGHGPFMRRPGPLQAELVRELEPRGADEALSGPTTNTPAAL